MKYEVIVMGVSAGGMEALGTILPHLSEDFALCVIIVQHVHPGSDDFLARSLNERCKLKVKQADEKESILMSCPLKRDRAIYKQVGQGIKP